jgi:NADPH:quinone reductase-like Zn-dependent oxidoreductase
MGEETTKRDPMRCDAMRRRGHRVYSLTRLCQTVLAMTAGRGVDNVVEVAGWATCGKSVRCTRKGGLVAVTGYLSTYNKVPDEIVQQGECGEARSAQRGAWSVERGA